MRSCRGGCIQNGRREILNRMPVIIYKPNTSVNVQAFNSVALSSCRKSPLHSKSVRLDQPFPRQSGNAQKIPKIR